MDTAPGRSLVPLITSVLGAGFVAGLVPSGLLPANVLNIEHEYGLSHHQVGRMIGLCMVMGGGPGGLLGGWLCGKIGAIRNMLLSLVMTVVALGLVGAVPGLTASVGGIWGYFFSMGFLASSNVLATVMLPDRHRGLTLLHTFNALGKLAGPVLGTMSVYGMWRRSFLAAAALPLVLIVPTLLAHANGDTAVGRKAPTTGRAGMWFWLGAAGFGLIAGGEIAVALWIPAFAKQVRAYTGSQANLLLSIFLCGLIAGRIACSALAHAIDTRRSIALCGVCTIFAVPSLLLQQFAYAAISFFLLGLAYSSTWPSYFAHLSEVFPEHIGLMGGAALLSTQVGFAVCSYASGRLAEISLAYPIVFGAAVLGGFVLAFFASPLSKPLRGSVK